MAAPIRSILEASSASISKRMNDPFAYLINFLTDFVAVAVAVMTRLTVAIAVAVMTRLTNR